MRGVVCAEADRWAAEQFGNIDFNDGRLSKESLP